MTYTPSTALIELLEQHDKLRELMDACDELADEADRTGNPVKLTREVAKLRLAFEAHNKFEEAMLRPVLLAADAFGSVRIDQMITSHVHEHATIRGRLHGWVTEELRGVIASLREHLDAEERYFLTTRVIRDDVVTIETGG